MNDMFIKAIEYGPNGNETTAADPSWDFVEAIIRSLDGHASDGVALDSSGTSYMGISGGQDGRYVVAGFLEGFGSFICASGEAGPPKEVVVAGDYNTYASSNVVGVETAIRAAKAFFERGLLSKGLKWEAKHRPT